MKIILLLLTSLSFAVSTLAQQKFYNNNYKLQRQEIKIALIPFLTGDKLYTQTIIESLSQDSLKKVSLADIEKVSNNILNDILLHASLYKIITKEYSSSALKHKPNLMQLIDGNTMSYMKMMLDTSDLLLLPSDIQMRTVKNQNGNGNTTVYGRFRLYDLNTGAFVFDYVARKKVRYVISEKEIRKIMSLLLEDFYSYFYKNLIARNNMTNDY